MEVQINIEMYFSRSPPQAPIFFSGGEGHFFKKSAAGTVTPATLQCVWSETSQKIIIFCQKCRRRKGGGFIKPESEI